MSGGGYSVLVFSGVNMAVKAEALLLGAGLRVTVMPTPPDLRSGCGIALRVSEDMTAKALEVLSGNAVEGVTAHPLLPPERRRQT